MLLAITLTGLLNFVIMLLIIGIVIGVLWYLITALFPIPEPLGKFVRAIIIVIGAILLIWLLIGLINGDGYVFIK